jgi:catechol 2,3-dioxygenase-like lactoylglutathione lyase family enzyme
MRDYQYDHVHLRSPDPDATARFFETLFGAEVTAVSTRPARSIRASSASRCGWVVRPC